MAKRKSKVTVRKVTGSSKPTPLPKASLTLRLKALFYRYTGIFLADKETLEYIHSDAYWKEFTRMAKYNKQNDMSFQTLHDLMIGLFQAKHGFARPWGHLPMKIHCLKYKYSILKYPINFIENIMTTYLVLKWDLKSLFSKSP